MADGNLVAEKASQSDGAAQRSVVIVAGMHRSGSSAITRVLNLNGLGIADDLMAPAEDNQKGFWESQSMAAFHDRFFASLDYAYDRYQSLPEDALSGEAGERLFDRIVDHLEGLPGTGDLVIKDPRMSLVLPIWKRATQQLGMQPKVLIANRNPIEVAASLDRRDRFSFEKSMMLWLRYMIEAERGSRDVPRVVVNYTGLLDDWHLQVQRVGAQLNVSSMEECWQASGDEIAEQVDGFLTRDLRHHVIDDHTVFEDPRANDWVRQLFQEFRRAGRDEPNTLSERVDQVAEAFDASSNVIEQYISQFDARIYALAMEKENVSAELDELQVSAQDSQQKLTTEQSRAEELSRNLDEARNELSRVAPSAERISKMLEEHVAREIAAPAVDDERLAELEEELRQKQAEIDKYRNELEQSRSEASRDVQRLEVKLEQEVSSRVSAEEKLTSAEQSLSAAHDEVETLKVRLASEEFGEEAVDRLVEERITALVESDLAAREALAQLERSISEEQQGRAVLEKELGRAEGRLKDAAVAHDQIIAGLRDELAEQKAGAEKERSRDRQAIGIAEGQVAALQLEIERVQRNLAVSETKLEHQQVQAADLRAELDARAASLDLLNNQLEVKAEALNEARIAAARHEAKLEAADANITRLNHELEAAKGAEARLKQVEANNLASAREIETLRRERSEESVLLNAEIAQLTQDANALVSEREGLSAELSKSREEFASLVEELTNSRQQLEDSRQELTSSRQQLEDSRQELADTRDGLAGERDVALAGKEELEHQAASLTRALHDAEAAKSEMAGQLQAKRAEIEASQAQVTQNAAQMVDRIRQYGLPIDGSEDPTGALLEHVEKLDRKNQWLSARMTGQARQVSPMARSLVKAGPVTGALALLSGSYSGRVVRNPIAALKLGRAADDIRKSGLFDEAYYCATHWDVELSNEDPIVHYLTNGAKEGRDPSPHFSTEAYLKANPDVREAGINPLLHYVRGGRDAGRRLTPPRRDMNEYDPLDIDRDPYSIRPDEIVMAEARRGEDFFKRFGLLGDQPDYEGATRTIAESDRTEACLNAHDPVHVPAASLVVPVYGQLAYTLNCLDSLRRHVSRYGFEVIVYDDVSPDDVTEAYLRQIPWIKYIRADQNRGFIHSCNAGASQARGEYFVMLNNDTRVVDGWLNEMIDLFHDRPRAGLVGSKLFYPDGSLQEAGGIVWQDGSAWNYGRNDDPNRPEYCYARQIDYVSGAAIAVRQDVWHTLGGFDGETYERAYYEDTDMAFRIREMGLETWMQPLSRVIHYEGKTSGTDVGSGEKAYQVSNRERFLNRWQDTLAEHRPNAERPWREANRPKPKRALIIDATTPTPDKDSGSLDLFNLFKMLDELGYASVFAPEDNMLFFGDYTRQLQRMGVQCLYHPFALPLKPFLEEHGAEFELVILHRLEPTQKWFDTIRETCPNAKLVYNTVDLHHVRERREAELYSKPELHKRADESEKIELDLISRSDHSIVVSSVESSILSKRLDGVKVSHLPLIREIPGTKADFEARHGLVFVGGFAHGPNVDAVSYFAEEVWPSVRAAVPGITLTIYGSKMPDEVRDLSRVDGIEPVGFVEELDKALDAARLMIAPLRFGAGAKGKVISSLSHGLPCVASPVAAEGMLATQSDGLFVVEDVAGYVKAVETLYTDPVQWTEASANATDFARRQNSLKRGVDILRDDIGL